MPVILGDRVLGVVSYDKLILIPAAELEQSYVTLLMTHVEDLDEVPATTSADEAIGHLAQNKVHAVALTNQQGMPVGVVTPESVMQWLGANRSSEQRERT